MRVLMSLGEDVSKEVGESETAFDYLLLKDWNVCLNISIRELLVLNSSYISKFASVV